MKVNDYKNLVLLTVRLGPKSKRHARKPVSTAISINDIGLLQPKLAHVRRDFLYERVAQQSSSSKSFD